MSETSNEADKIPHYTKAKEYCPVSAGSTYDMHAKPRTFSTTKTSGEVRLVVPIMTTLTETHDSPTTQ